MKWIRYLVVGIMILLAVVPSSAGAEDTLITATIPLITHDASIVDVTPSTAKIAWSTNGPSTSLVVYDSARHDNVEDYSMRTSWDYKLVTDHRMSLRELAAGKTYHFRVMSTVENLTAVSDDYAFTTKTRGRSPRWNWWRW